MKVSTHSIRDWLILQDKESIPVLLTHLADPKIPIKFVVQDNIARVSGMSKPFFENWTNQRLERAKRYYPYLIDWGYELGFVEFPLLRKYRGGVVILDLQKGVFGFTLHNEDEALTLRKEILLLAESLHLPLGLEHYYINFQPEKKGDELYWNPAKFINWLGKVTGSGPNPDHFYSLFRKDPLLDQCLLAKAHGAGICLENRGCGKFQIGKDGTIKGEYLPNRKWPQEIQVSIAAYGESFVIWKEADLDAILPLAEELVQILAEGMEVTRE